MRSSVSRVAKVIVPLAAIALVAPVVPATASPATVDYVVTAIGRNVDAGKWGVASKNIEDLDKTIYDALNNRRVPVQVRSNPVKTRLTQVTDRGRYLLQEQAAMVAALNKLEGAQANVTTGALMAIFYEMYRQLSLIKASPDLPDAISAGENLTAQQIIASFKRLKSIKKMIAYLNTLIASLRPAINEVKADRVQLLKLDAQLNGVLRKYGIRVGGPAVQPQTTPPPPAAASFSGRWSAGSAWGDLTITQNGTSVTGTYSHENGRLQGTVSGNVLTCRWSEEPSYAGPRDAGTCTATISEDGRSFSGSYTYDGGGGGAFNGTRI